MNMDLKGQSWLVLPALLVAGQKFREQKAQEAKQLKEEELHGRRRRRRREEDKLKNRESWWGSSGVQRAKQGCKPGRKTPDGKRTVSRGSKPD